jgi:hypothetical protein
MAQSVDIMNMCTPVGAKEKAGSGALRFGILSWLPKCPKKEIVPSYTSLRLKMCKQWAIINSSLLIIHLLSEAVPKPSPCFETGPFLAKCEKTEKSTVFSA